MGCQYSLGISHHLRSYDWALIFLLKKLERISQVKKQKQKTSKIDNRQFYNQYILICFLSIPNKESNCNETKPFQNNFK